MLFGLMIMEGVVVGLSVTTIDAPDDNTEEGLIEDEKPPELLCLPLLKRLALARILELWLKIGVLSGAELAGVAMRVGLMLLRVLVATVVLTARLVGRTTRRGLRPRIGRMTGVNVFPGREIEARSLVLDGRIIRLLPTFERSFCLVSSTASSSSSSSFSSSSSPSSSSVFSSSSSSLLVRVRSSSSKAKDDPTEEKVVVPSRSSARVDVGRENTVCSMTLLTGDVTAILSELLSPRMAVWSIKL